MEHHAGLRPAANCPGNTVNVEQLAAVEAITAAASPFRSRMPSREAMTGSTVILSSIFALAESAVEHGISGRWGVLGERISEEIKDLTVKIEFEV